MKPLKPIPNAGPIGVPLLSLSELEEMEAIHDPHVMFHGTSTAYSTRIEQDGWVRGCWPYEETDMTKVVNLSDRYPADLWAAGILHHNLRPRESEHSGAYFTYEVRGAREYAGATGGETIRNAVSVLESIRPHLLNISDRAADLEQTDRLLDLWKPLIEDSLPVVYAVRVTENMFPDVIPKEKSSWTWQMETLGRIETKRGDFCALHDIPSSAILGKAVLTKSNIEPLFRG